LNNFRFGEIDFFSLFCRCLVEVDNNGNSSLLWTSNGEKSYDDADAAVVIVELDVTVIGVVVRLLSSMYLFACIT